MSLSVGIVGLPNVGKSTLFNALTRSKQADAQNYPFCTIDPNIGVVEVPDARLQKLAAVSQSQKIIPTVIEFVDIAGLVKGASEGEGLGNKFLSHIRETDAIVQVVRSFSDSNVAHVQNRVNPQEDADIINLELALADLETVTKKLGNTKRSAKGVAAKDFQKQIELLERVEAQLQAGKPARDLEYNEDEILWMKELQLLTMKPMLYVVEYVTFAVASVRSEPAADDSLAAIRERSKLGMAIAAMIKMIATTISNSINENPFSLFISSLSKFSQFSAGREPSLVPPTHQCRICNYTSK